MKALIVLVIIPLCQCLATTKDSTASVSSSEVSDLYKELNLMKQELQRSNDERERALSVVKESLDRKDAELQELRDKRVTAQASAFSAMGLSVPGPHTYSSGDKLAFPFITYNDGGYYNGATGEYTCPTQGLYLFTYTVYGYELKGATNINVALLTSTLEPKNKAFVMHDGTDNLYTTASGSLVLQCFPGHKVWLQVQDSDTRLYGDMYRNIFSGILITAV